MTPWTHSDEIRLSYLRLLARNAGLRAEDRDERDQLEAKFERLTGERFPGTVAGRISAKHLKDGYSTHYKNREKDGDG